MDKRKIDLKEIETFIFGFIKNYPGKTIPKDITDQIFCAIDQSSIYLRYNRLIGEKKERQEAVNQQIGKMVKLITGLEVTGQCDTPRSTLIKTYSELG